MATGLDPSIITDIGNLNDPNKAAVARINALKALQAQQDFKAQNSLRQMLQQPGSIDERTGMISQNTMNAMMKMSPEFAYKLSQNQLDLEKTRAEVNQTYMGLVDDAGMPAVLAYDEAFKSTGSRDQALAAAQRAWEPSRQELVTSGSLPPDVSDKLPTQFNPELFKLHSKQYQAYSKEQTGEQRAGVSDYINAVNAGIDPSSIGISAPGQAASPQLSETGAANAVADLFPGSRITSEQRTPQHNKEVGGVPDSAHITGQAIDFVKPKGSSLTADQVKAKLQAKGLPVTSVLDEGDHFHWEWEPKGGGPTGPAFSGPGKGATFITDPTTGKQYIANPSRPGKYWDAQTGQPTQGPSDFGKTGTTQDVPQPGDPRVKAEADMIANYRLPPLSNFVMKTPYGQAVMSMVNQENPNYDATQYNAKNRAVTAFDSGTQGNQVRSLNVAIQHMNLMDQLSAAIKNGNVQSINAIKNRFAEEFGGADVTNFDVAKGIVGDEIVKAVVAGGGALADRENAQNQISRAKSFDQLTGAFQTARKLLSGQLKGLKRQYESSTGLTDFDKKLDPETRAQLESHTGTGAQKSGKRAKDMTDDELRRSLGL